VLGHYFEGMPTDPWNTVTYQTDENGVALISMQMPGFSLYGTNPVLGRAAVVHLPATAGGARIGCGLIASTSISLNMVSTVDIIGDSKVDQLNSAIENLGASNVDVLAAWMQITGMPVLSIMTFLLVSACTVLLIPAILQWLAVGYSWTLGFGGTFGVAIGTLSTWLGMLFGCSICYLLGHALFAKSFDRTKQPRSCIAQAMTRMEDTPFRLLILLRLCPLIPFNLLNYHVGASYRFTFCQSTAALIFIIPIAFVWVGMGGAIAKADLVAKGLEDSSYMNYVWAGIGVTSSLIVITSLIALCVLRRTLRPEFNSTKEITMTGMAEKASTCQRRSYCRAGADDAMPPPPPGAFGDLKPGWREIISDDGETYYFNEDTGESQWDPPLAVKASTRGSLPVGQPLPSTRGSVNPGVPSEPPPGPPPVQPSMAALPSPGVMPPPGPPPLPPGVGVASMPDMVAE